MTPLQRRLYHYRHQALYGAVLCFGLLGASLYLKAQSGGLQVNSRSLCGLTDVVCENEALIPATNGWFDVYPVQAEILRQTKAAGWNEAQQNVALQVARCESGFNPLAKNNGSTATGIYQFTLGTWQHIGNQGDRLDFQTNIAAFVRWYPKYPDWWVCQG